MARHWIVSFALGVAFGHSFGDFANGHAAPGALLLFASVVGIVAHLTGIMRRSTQP